MLSRHAAPAGLTLAALALLAPLALTGCGGGGNGGYSTPTTPVTPAPTVTAVSPSSGPAGTPVTITGTGFVNVTAVDFGGTPAASYTVVSPTQITALAPTPTVNNAKAAVKSPTAKAAGSVSSHGTLSADDITVVTSAGTSAPVAADRFSYDAPPPPAVGAVSPADGPSAGGTAVTITGSGFLPGSTVNFGSSPATNVAVVSSTEITATSPAGTGTADVTVTDANGTSATTSADQFTYAAAPTISGVSPTTVFIGQTVTLTGTNFTGATQVTVGVITNPTLAPVVFTVVSPTQITFTMPNEGTAPFPGPIPAEVQVTTPSGTASAGFSYDGAP